MYVYFKKSYIFFFTACDMLNNRLDILPPIQHAYYMQQCFTFTIAIFVWNLSECKKFLSLLMCEHF